LNCLVDPKKKGRNEIDLLQRLKDKT